MIRNSEPLSMSESLGYLDKDEKSKELEKFVKNFTKLKSEKAEELRKNLSELKIIKLNQNHICKIIDFLPANGEDLNKVANDANLDEDETKKVLDTVKEFK